MEPGYSYIPTTGLKRTKRKVCPKITHQMLNTRMPLMDVIAVAGTLVLKIFFVLRSREKHKNTSQSFARMGNINIIITDLKCFVLYLMPLHVIDATIYSFLAKMDSPWTLTFQKSWRAESDGFFPRVERS